MIFRVSFLALGIPEFVTPQEPHREAFLERFYLKIYEAVPGLVNCNVTF